MVETKKAPKEETHKETTKKTKEAKRVRKSIDEKEAQEIRAKIKSVKVEIPEALRVLGSEISLKVLEALKHKPLSFNEIAKVLEKSPQAMFVKVQSMQKAGLLVKEESKYKINEETLKEIKEFVSKL